MPADERDSMRALSDAQIKQFIQDGFVRIDRAFPRELADEYHAILWRDTGCDPDDSTTWTKPVIRLGGYMQEPFMMAQSTPVLDAAFDQLVGKGRWRRRSNLAGFPVRFPSPDDPGDTGWHVDVSFPGESGDPNETKDFSAWVTCRAAPQLARLRRHHLQIVELLPLSLVGLTSRHADAISCAGQCITLT
jgi:hypothetical protein